MLRIFAAAALTIIGPLILIAVCYAVSYIPFVKRMLYVDENESLITRVIDGFIAIVICIVAPVSVLFLLLLLFVAFYGLL